MTQADRTGWREEPPPFDRDAYPDAIVARARRGWQRLYDDERDSLIAASMALADLTRLGAPTELLAEAARVVEDEVRHTRVCAHVVGALGAAPDEVDPETTRAPADEPIAERSAKLLILGFAVGESMSAACFVDAREHCEAPLARWAYTELLRDEARHGGFGASAGAWVLEQLPPDFAPRLWPSAVAEMEAMEARVGGPFDEAKLAREAAVEGLAQLEALGLLRGSISCRAFHRAIERWVVPRLRSLGVIIAD